MTDRASEPVRRFKAGSASPEVWATRSEGSGGTVTRYSVRIEKRHRDKDGNFRTWHTLSPSGLRARVVDGAPQ